MASLPFSMAKIGQVPAVHVMRGYVLTAAGALGVLITVLKEWL